MPADKNTTTGRDVNPDPITGEPGAHPVGTGVGAAAGGAAGAAIGAAGGPVGAAVGAVIGAIAGGLAGKGVAEMVDPTVEDAHWREHHASAPFPGRDRPYEDFAPAYRTGYMGYREGRSFDEREAELRMEYEGGQAGVGAPPSVTEGEQRQARTSWEEAREAARVAYERVQRGENRPRDSQRQT